MELIMNEDLFQLGVKALIENKEGKILLLKVNAAKLKNFTGDPYYDIPGGRLHRGSTIEETLKREVLEETGIKEANVVRPFIVCLSNRRIPLNEIDTGLILDVYRCKINSETITLSDEHTEYGWFSPAEASELLKVKYPVEFTNLLVKNSF